jgi:oligosaccharyltransferase complex subunit gamma
MPLFMQDRNQPGKLLFFYQGSGMQLGAEGFVVGFLYTVVGLLLGFITQFAARIKSRMVQQILMLVGIVISFLAVRKVVLLDNWKTGYWIHAFWPTRWT